MPAFEELEDLADKARAFKFGLPNEVTSKAGYFAFVLSSFGLQRLKVHEYKEGKALEVKEGQFNDATGYEYTDKGQLNMHTGKDGQPPMSILGTPVFSDLKLTSTRHIDFALGPEDVSETVHLLWALVEVQQNKNIVKTKVQGRDGEVKEYISDGDYSITIRGAFADTFKKSYPKDAVKKLIRMCKVKEALKVTSEYLLMFDVHQLVIESFRFSQEEGKQNIQKFELHCSSDEPLILKKKRGV